MGTWLPPLDPATLRPMPPRPELQQLVFQELFPVPGALDALEAVRRDVAPTLDPDLDTPFATDVAPAADALDAIGSLLDDTDHATMRAAGDVAGEAFDAQMRDLPNLDAAVPAFGLDGPIDPEPTPREPEPGEPPPPPPLTPDEVRAAIRQMYRTELLREATADEVESWAREILVYHRTLAWVHDQIVASDEWRATHPSAPAPAPAAPPAPPPPAPPGDLEFTGGVQSWSDAAVVWAAAHPDTPIAGLNEWTAAPAERRRRSLGD